MAKKKEPRFIMDFPLYANSYEKTNLDNIFVQSCQLYNYMLNETLKRFNSLDQDKQFRKNICFLKAINRKIKNLEKQLIDENDKKKIAAIKTKLKLLETEKKGLYKEQNDLMMQFGYNEYALHQVAVIPKHYFTYIDINTAQKLATRAFKAVEKLRQGKAKRVRFIRRNQLESVEGKNNKSGIIFKKVKNQFVVKIQGMTISVKVSPKDKYAQEALSDLSSICFCRIVRREIRGIFRYFVQLTMKGNPPRKKRKLGKGKVGIDPGIQMMAVSSDVKTMLAELSPQTQKLEEEIRLLQRKLERSRRANNPNKYNGDGTFNKRDKSKWVNSKNYQKDRSKLKELQRKEAAIRKQSHNRLTNVFLRFGDSFYIEKNEFKAFQRRANKTTFNQKKKRYNSKKRNGKSIKNKAPSMFLTLLKNKVNALGGTIIDVNPRIAKPSQYDHLSNTFVKKKLSQRWHILSDGTEIQRDLYSSFLIRNVDAAGSINQQECEKNFKRFYDLHQIEIQRIKKAKTTVSAFGL